jgi:hypothetical protein
MGAIAKSEFRSLSLMYIDSEIDKAKGYTARLATAHNMIVASKGSKNETAQPSIRRSEQPIPEMNQRERTPG